MVATARTDPPFSPPDVDHRVTFHKVTWAQYEAILDIRGEAPLPRISYLTGELELMSPSRRHETCKSLFGRLFEAYAEEAGIELVAYGSMTLRNAPLERGVEPDESYAIGGPKDLPDLAIEVIWTSGSLDKLEIYRGLGIREVWLWRDQVLSVHVLRGDAYAQAQRSELFPDLDLPLLASFLGAEKRTQAVRDYRAAIRARLGR
jgi:Uma2 family endonuclease